MKIKFFIATLFYFAATCSYCQIKRQIITLQAKPSAQTNKTGEAPLNIRNIKPYTTQELANLYGVTAKISNQQTLSLSHLSEGNFSLSFYNSSIGTDNTLIVNGESEGGDINISAKLGANEKYIFDFAISLVRPGNQASQAFYVAIGDNNNTMALQEGHVNVVVTSSDAGYYNILLKSNQVFGLLSVTITKIQ